MKGLRFVFVARRWRLCLRDPSCNPDQLLFERQIAILRRLMKVAATAGLRLDHNLFGSNFADQFSGHVALAPSVPGAEAITGGNSGS